MKPGGQRADTGGIKADRAAIAPAKVRFLAFMSVMDQTIKYIQNYPLGRSRPIKINHTQASYGWFTHAGLTHTSVNRIIESDTNQGQAKCFKPTALTPSLVADTTTEGAAMDDYKTAVTEAADSSLAFQSPWI